MINRLLVVMMAVSISAFLVSCSDDEEPTPSSSATLEYDGKTYTLASDEEFTYLEWGTDDTYYTLSGTLVNGEDSIDLSMKIPALEVGTYTLAANEEDASLDITIEGATYSSPAFTFFDSDEDQSNFTITVTEVTDNSVKGNFSGSLQNGNGEELELVSVSGEFEALDWAVVLEDALGDLLD